MKIQYIANDGKIFDSMQECQQHEWKDLGEIQWAIKAISAYCDKQSDCHKCPFWREDAKDCFFQLNDPCMW